jgi:DNA-binding GntR family transcriptional regulator
MVALTDEKTSAVTVASELGELAPLTRDPLHERVYLELKRALMAGRLSPGRRLTVRGVAQALGTSNSPVRAALNRLFAERAIDLLPNGSMIVPRMSEERFVDLMNTRMLLEGHAAELAAPHFSAQQLEKIACLADALDASAQAANITEYLDLNQKFKFSIYEQCGSELLLSLIEIVWLQVGPVLTHYAPTLPRILEIDHHRAVIEALRAGDPIAARKAIVLDISEGRDYLRTILDSAKAGLEAPSSLFALQR